MKITFNSTSIPASSRAAHYGDGCFTTMLYDGFQIQHWALHLSRLTTSCFTLQLTGFSPEQLKKAIDNWLSNVASEVTGKCVVKVMISAPCGGRGYARSNDGELQVMVTTHPFPEHYLDWQQNGVVLGISTVRLGSNRNLAGIKHLNRLEQVLVKSQQLNGCDDVLVCDSENMLVEASASNVFWRIASQWFTPDLSESGVSGVKRKHVLNRLAQAGENVMEVRLTPNALFDADELFICNCVMGLVPVSKVKFNGELEVRAKVFPVHSDYFNQLLTLTEELE